MTKRERREMMTRMRTRLAIPVAVIPNINHIVCVVCVGVGVGVVWCGCGCGCGTFLCYQCQCGWECGLWVTV